MARLLDDDAPAPYVNKCDVFAAAVAAMEALKSYNVDSGASCVPLAANGSSS